MDTYWKYQAEKERKLYAVIDGFAQNHGQLGLSDARYVNALKLFLQGVTPLEYQAHRGFAFAGRHLRGVGPRVRRADAVARRTAPRADRDPHASATTTSTSTASHEFRHMHDRVWYLSVPKSFFDDALTAGPFEYLIAIGFSFEYLLTNLLFVPFMSGAAYNGDLPTMTFGFSAQSDESRHMTLGLEAIKFLLEQDPDNLPIVQDWIDKWFWRGYRAARPRRHDDGLHAAQEGHVLEGGLRHLLRAADAGGSLFQDLAYYGIGPPKYADVATRRGRSHLAPGLGDLYQFTHAAAFHTWIPDDEHLDWLSEKYPSTFDRYYRPRWERGEDGRGGQALLQPGAAAAVPDLPDPDGVHRARRPDDHLPAGQSSYEGERYTSAPTAASEIFDHEPEKYVQAWLPVHQIYQGNCGGATVPDVLAWYKMNVGADNMDYVGSPDEKLWNEWHAKQALKAG